MSEATSRPLTRASIFAQAWPIIVGQASVPLVGIVDATVVGRTGDAVALAGVALGATIIELIFWTFGFLRMGLTGFTSQAEGAGNRREVEALLLRALLIGLGIGALLTLLQYPITNAALAIMSGGPGVSAEASGYVAARFYGAPAALCVFALTGWLFGLGRTRSALVLQIVMNAANIALDLLFVWGFDMGATGVGIGTAGAEWIAFATGLVLAARIVGVGPVAMWRRLGTAAILDPAALRHLIAVNRDIMLRTIALLLLFTWLANAGARLGAATLAANHVLLQFVNVSAYVLDAFAFTAEERVGQAVGRKSRKTFLRAIRLTGEFSLLGGAALALLFWLAGDYAIAFITTDAEVRAVAGSFLIFAALIPFIGMPSWLFDGIFIGATRGTALRNAALFSTSLYIAMDFSLRPLGNQGVWIAFTASYLLRAIGLAWYFPALLRSLDTPQALAERDKPA